MKSKKAIKKLTKVEELLKDVLDQYVPNGHDVRELLDSAIGSVAQAKDTVTVGPSPAPIKKGPSSKKTNGKRKSAKVA